jgi:hypothetical protein
MVPISIAPSATGPRLPGEADAPPRPRRQHRQQRRHDHLLDRGRVSMSTPCRSPASAAFHDARHLAELTAHLDDDAAGRAADRLHGHGAEQVRHHAADEQADQHIRVASSRTTRRRPSTGQVDVGERREQHQRGEPAEPMA